MGNKSKYIINETTDYSRFVKLLGNREVTPQRLSSIKESILRIGYQPSPILVNEKWEVIDGQGRLAACEALSLPVYYIVKDGLDINDCISMNIKMKNWGPKDYINCYEARGVQGYVDLKEMMVEFPLLNWKQLCDIEGIPAGLSINENMENGRLQFKPFTYSQYERARWLSMLIPKLKKSGLYTNRAVDVLVRLDRYKLIDKKRMLDSIMKYGESPEFSAYRAKDTLKALNDIYNYNRKQKKYFSDDYRRIADSAKEANLKKKEDEVQS